MDGNVPAPGPRQPRRLFTLPRAVLLVLVLALIAALPSLHGLIGRTADTITAKGKYVPQVRSYFIAADETSDARQLGGNAGGPHRSPSEDPSRWLPAGSTLGNVERAGNRRNGATIRAG